MGNLLNYDKMIAQGLGCLNKTLDVKYEPEIELADWNLLIN